MLAATVIYYVVGAVTVIVGLWVVAATLGWAANSPNRVVYGPSNATLVAFLVTGSVAVGLGAAMAVFTAVAQRGHNGARIVLTVLTATMLVASTALASPTASTFLTAPAPQLLLLSVPAVVALVLLWLPGSSRWYRARKTSKVTAHSS